MSEGAHVSERESEVDWQGGTGEREVQGEGVDGVDGWMEASLSLGLTDPGRRATLGLEGIATPNPNAEIPQTLAPTPNPRPELPQTLAPTPNPRPETPLTLG